MGPKVLNAKLSVPDDRATQVVALLESLRDPIFSVDRNLALVAYNRAFADSVLKFRGKAIAPGMTALDVVPRRRATLWNALLSRALNEGSYQYELELPEGLWLELSLNQIEANGSIVGVSVFGRDVTERKRAEASLREAEEALRESEALFRSYFQLPLVGFSIVHPGKTGIIANERLCEILGYSAEELSGLSWTDITHPDDLEKSLLEFDRLLAGEIQSFSLEKRYVRKDGAAIWAVVAVRCVRNPDGTVKQVCGYVQDISERKAAEQAILKAEREYREIFERAPEGIFKTSREGKSLSLNPAGAHMLGYSSSEDAVSAVTDSGNQTWMRAEDRERYVAELEEHGEVHDRLCQFKTKDGRPVWVSMTARRVAGEDGKTLFYQGYFVNVSDRKRLEAELSEHLREVKILSEMNSALLHAREERELLEDYCRIIVETGGYLMAWVGFAEEEPEKIVVPVAWFGNEGGYLSEIKVTWDGGELSRGPTGKAIFSGSIEAATDFDADPGIAPFAAKLAKRGYKSSIAVPFRPSPGTMAVLTAYGASRVAWSDAERRLMDQVASALGYGIRTLRDQIAKDQYHRDLRNSLEQTIQVIADTVDRRDPYTSGHQRRVADLTMHIARAMALPEERVHGLRLAASIHDLGKVGIPSEILAKPGRLTPTQLSLVKEHVQLGYDIVKDVQFPWPIADAILQHHERMDGSGYPQGLTGDAILLESRILAVADVVESMATHRPYRPALGIDEALNEILSKRGKLYDAEAVDACVRVFCEQSYHLVD